MIERSPPSSASETDYESLVELLRRRRQLAPDQLAYQFLVDGKTEGDRLTYKQLDERARAIARRLRQVGGRGDRALLLFPPGLEFLSAFFACLQSGMIAVPLPPPDSVRLRRALPRLQSVIRDAKASLILTTRPIEALLRGHFDQLDDLRNLTWLNAESIDPVDPMTNGDGGIWEPSADDIAFLQYTSGSTSAPKGVMVSHGNVLQNCRAQKVAGGYDSDSVTCTWMPYHHDYGLIEGLIHPLYVGAACYAMSPIAFVKRPHRWLEAISKYRVTHSQGPNFAYDLCVQKVSDKQCSQIDLSSWKVAAIGAEPIRPATLRQFHQRFQSSGFRWEALAPAYGLAESTLVATHAPPEKGPTFIEAAIDAYERGRIVKVDTANGSPVSANGSPDDMNRRTRTLVSCGQALEGTQIEIVNSQTRLRCGPGEVGEIWIASPSVTQGYWNRPDETDRTFHAQLADSGEGPFLRTGDLGCFQDDQLFIIGREKDLIIIRGVNHYPQDIEQTVEACHPAIRASNGAAFSLEVDGEEELVIVYEVRGKHLRQLDSQAVLSAIREAVFQEHDLQTQAIALWKPGAVPKTTSGKIQRRRVKTDFLENRHDVVANWHAPVRISSQAPHHVSAVHSIGAIRQWITEWLVNAGGMSTAAIDRDTKFADCGVDSLRAADLASELEQWLGKPVDPILFWNFTTIDALATHLGEQIVTGSMPDESEPTGPMASTTDAISLKKSPTASSHGSGGIAVIGIGCRFPGNVNSPQAYWQLLREGREGIIEIPPDRWNVETYFDRDRSAAGKMYVRHGGFIQQAEQFDAAFFGITPREAEQLDPQQRLLLQVTWESLEHAGIAPSSLRESDCGVFVGLCSDDFATHQSNTSTVSSIEPYQTLGTARSFAAGRVSYFLGLRGPALQTDTACSSSLVSVYQACQSLLAGESSLAIAGGVNLMLSPATMIALCKLTALAADGRCKTFDAAADGYVRGEGCGMVVLKRIEDAIEDGDTILATIRSAAINHDGASNGLTAPHGPSQQQLLCKALAKARLDGGQVSYVEAHGTGTELGDPIELAAIDSAYDANRRADHPLYVGSMKPNLGHLEGAAGIAGLIKVVLMLQNREIPPQLHFDTPNPHVCWDKISLRVPTQLQPWPDRDLRGLAAVSSFGFSGTNAHVILEAANPVPPNCEHQKNDDQKSERESRWTRNGSVSAPALYFLPLSAKSESSLTELGKKYIDHIATHPEQLIENICFTAATTRDHFKYRLAVIASSRDELLKHLRDFVSGGDLSKVVRGSCAVGGDRSANTLGFLFTGQGTQYVGMGRQLYDSQPVFRHAIDHCGQVLQDHWDVSLTEVLYGSTASTNCLLNQTTYTQSALLALQFALGELWKAWGIRPAAVMGHSSGEYAAAVAAGVIRLEVALELLATRGRLIDGLSETGTMAVVMADEARVRTAIAPLGDQVSIAALNGPEILVISGKADAVDRVLSDLTADGIDVERLRTSNAGHSALIDPMLAPFAEVARTFSYGPPAMAMVSNVSGKLAGAEVADHEYWVQHVRQPVRFADGMKTLAETGCQTFLELGPNPNLLAMGMACLKKTRPRPRWLPSLSKDRSGWETMLYSLAEIYTAGFEIDWHGFHQPYDRQRVSLPTYAFEPQSYPLRRGEQDVTVMGGDHSAGESKSPMPAPSTIAARLDHLQVGLEDESRALNVPMDDAAIRFVIDALAQLGFSWQVGAAFPEQQLLRQIPERNRSKVIRVLSRLIERGQLEADHGVYRVLLAAPDVDAAGILDSLTQQNDYPECDLLRRAGMSLNRIWTGDVDPLTILFPNGETEQASAFYRHARLLAKYNQLAGDVIDEVVSCLPGDASIRVLEVGAGTGGLTSFLLPKLPEQRCEYLFTDISPLFLHAAKERFAPFPFLQTKLLDIGKPFEPQGFDPGSFDLVVAANALHATPRLHDTLGYVQQLLKPGGWLMLLEGANPPLWGDMVFTLIDGWWDFQDRKLRPDYPLMQSDRWVKVLDETQFVDVACLHDATSKQGSQSTLYLAQTGEVPVADSLKRGPLLAAHGAVAFGPGENSPGSSSPDAHTSAQPLDPLDQRRLADIIRNHAARVMRLKPEEIEWTQPLSELGLDSLMATELRAQLGDKFGRELSLNTLQMRQSVEEIAAYVHDDQCWENARRQEVSRSTIPDLEVNAPRAHLIPLQPTGTKTPLFFIPAGYGDLFAFQQISHAIGMNQPVFGLQPASANRVKTFRQMSIYRLVSAYISQIKSVQPQGPYYLSGYSAGAIIAVELARELKRQGHEIGLLVIFDPPSHVPFWLDMFYIFNYRLTVATGLMNLVGRLRSNFARRLFHTMLDEGLRTHTSVTREHKVAPYPGRITHFRARLSQSSLVSTKPVGWFWRKTALEGIEIHWIPGTHYGMLRGAGASVVVDELRDCLERATSSRSGKLIQTTNEAT